MRPAVDRRVSPSRGPAVVRDVEVTEPFPSIPGSRPDGSRTDRAWLLVRRCSQPLGLLRVDLPASGLTPAEVASAVHQAFGALPSGGARYLAARAEALATAPDLTVVICTRGRPDSLARTVDSVVVQGCSTVRVLVVDNAPADGSTREVVRAAARRGAVDYLVAPAPGLSHARNAAVAAAPGETLAWIDDDEIVDEHWLAEIAWGLRAHPTADILCGSVIPAELETEAQLWFEQFGGLVKGRGFTPAVFGPATRSGYHPLFPLPPFGAGANMVTRPGVIERLGGFDPALGAGSPAFGGEDTLLFMELLRSGGTIAYEPGILTRHYHRRDLDGLRRQLVGYGTGLTAAYAALVRRHPSTIPALLGIVPRAARELFGRGGRRTATIEADFPADLLRANRRGMLSGPAAYRRGRTRTRSGIAR
jgi:glycosyltransferase involved in cell wall biosynthesis